MATNSHTGEPGTPHSGMHSGMLGLPLPAKPLSFSLEEHHYHFVGEDDVPAALEVACKSGSVSQRGSLPSVLDVNRIVAKMSAVRALYLLCITSGFSSSSYFLFSERLGLLASLCHVGGGARLLTRSVLQLQATTPQWGMWGKPEAVCSSDMHQAAVR